MTANHFPEHATGFQIDFLPSRLPLIFISVNYKNQLDDPKSLFKEDNKSYWINCQFLFSTWCIIKPLKAGFVFKALLVGAFEGPLDFRDRMNISSIDFPADYFQG